MVNIVNKLTAAVTLAVFIFLSSGIAQAAETVTSALEYMPMPGTLLKTSEAYQAPLLRGIKVYPNEPFKFDFILDQGDAQGLTADQLKAESEILVKYFLAGLTIPEKDLWVNLSPYEADRVVPEGLGQTDLGRDMLGEDYVLKQLASSLTHPDTETGKAYWDSISNVKSEISDLSKIWIVPDSATIYQDGTRAFVTESHLKVQCGKDLVGAIHESPSTSNDAAVSALLPAVEREVNTGAHFARLRQMYHSMLLATWYKNKLKSSLIAQVYADKNKTAGVDVSDPAIKEKIYEQYVASFKKGAYDYFAKERNPETQRLQKRQYFCGGLSFGRMSSAIRYKTLSDLGAVLKASVRTVLEVSVLSVYFAVANLPFTLGAVGDAERSSQQEDKSQNIVHEERPLGVNQTRVLRGIFDVYRRLGVVISKEHEDLIVSKVKLTDGIGAFAFGKTIGGATINDVIYLPLNDYSGDNCDGYYVVSLAHEVAHALPLPNDILLANAYSQIAAATFIIENEASPNPIPMSRERLNLDDGSSKDIAWASRQTGVNGEARLIRHYLNSRSLTDTLADTAALLDSDYVVPRYSGDRNHQWVYNYAAVSAFSKIHNYRSAQSLFQYFMRLGSATDIREIEGFLDSTNASLKIIKKPENKRKTNVNGAADPATGSSALNGGGDPSVSKASVATQRSASAIAADALKGKTILIADDEPRTRDILKEFFEMAGARVLEAVNGVDALAVYQAHRSEIAAVVTDREMPGGDGVTLIKALRVIDPNLPLALHSATPDGADIGADVPVYRKGAVNYTHLVNDIAAMTQRNTGSSSIAKDDIVEGDIYFPAAIRGKFTVYDQAERYTEIYRYYQKLLHVSLLDPIAIHLSKVNPLAVQLSRSALIMSCSRPAFERSKHIEQMISRAFYPGVDLSTLREEQKIGFMIAVSYVAMRKNGERSLKTALVHVEDSFGAIKNMSNGTKRQVLSGLYEVVKDDAAAALLPEAIGAIEAVSGAVKNMSDDMKRQALVAICVVASRRKVSEFAIALDELEKIAKSIEGVRNEDIWGIAGQLAVSKMSVEQIAAVKRQLHDSGTWRSIKNGLWEMNVGIAFPDDDGSDIPDPRTASSVLNGGVDMSVSKAAVTTKGSADAVAVSSAIPADFDLKNFTGFTPKIIGVRKVAENDPVFVE